MTPEAEEYLEKAFGSAKKFCEELGLEGQALTKVLKSEDSTFFIHAASMIEAALNSGLAKRISIQKSFGKLDEEYVLNIVERMSMGGANNKVEIALAAGLITEADKKFIEGINEVRNLYIHKFQNYGLSFSDLFNSLKPEKKKSLQTKLDVAKLCDNFEFDQNTVPAILKWSSGMNLVSVVHRVMEFRAPKGLLSLLGWTPEETPI